ncbi:MAG TPA: hypothetical protein ENN98_05905 [Desulfurivibrio alkaliphilus]|uniref:Beta-ketoacyl synthase N-terminal domain-containing protein n=1 Tax=Desulfurivibrio alkaliphilus TaxID=427923 RepID=A0A7C2XMW8_9BACT|nr:hypothetical protein [Desulfurivibrio alkaliphilus]
MPTPNSPDSRDYYRYAFCETASPEVTRLLAATPSRWGRMPPLSRALVVEAGRVLVENGLLAPGEKFSDQGKRVGLIGGTTTGSLATDLEFAATLLTGPNLASPALFGYTLPNIPLSEAANHFGLIGPVYAIFAPESPLVAAEEEAGRWLVSQPELTLMLACAFDSRPMPGQAGQLAITFTIVSR